MHRGLPSRMSPVGVAEPPSWTRGVSRLERAASAHLPWCAVRNCIARFGPAGSLWTVHTLSAQFGLQTSISRTSPGPVSLGYAQTEPASRGNPVQAAHRALAQRKAGPVWRDRLRSRCASGSSQGALVTLALVGRQGVELFDQVLGRPVSDEPHIRWLRSVAG